jgi:hypothetical protein
MGLFIFIVNSLFADRQIFKQDFEDPGVVIRNGREVKVGFNSIFHLGELEKIEGSVKTNP